MGTTIKSIPTQATWPLRRAVMWPDKPLDYIKLPQDHLGMHFGLFRDEELVTVASLFIIDNKAQFRKLATRTSEQGKGYGSLMLEHLLKVADSKGVEKIWCNARKEKTGFYHKMGLTETAQTFSKGNINYVVMEKMLP
ncbi:GNAT family N-acetyltransferase [Sediminicola sp. YIK13]|uniref:GNAT family N-acetyltransferase n=1 Tax=Sediminicola sp. YIK13 TaxID=1453352 RepID=UPI0007863615|nr:GNAT family N-acetyltransferase [Sediminicola sp. YIK13]